MHYTGTIWRPPYEASSLLLEVTAGCTHHKCKFCTLYNDLPFKFRMSPLEDIEADLQEAAHTVKLWKNFSFERTFLTGANPFVLKSHNVSDLTWRVSIIAFSTLQVSLELDEERLGRKPLPRSAISFILRK